MFPFSAKKKKTSNQQRYPGLETHYPKLKERASPLTKKLLAIGVHPDQLMLGAIASVLCATSLVTLWPKSALVWCFYALAAPLRSATLFIATCMIELTQSNKIPAVKYDRWAPRLTKIIDMTSESFLILAFAAIGPIANVVVIGVIVLLVLSELCGWLALITTKERHQEGPLGQSERTIMLVACAVLIARTPANALFVNLILTAGFFLLLMTTANRLNAITKKFSAKNPGAKEDTA